MHWLGADADAVVIALQRNIFAHAAMPQLDKWAKLLGPVSGHASADSQNSQLFLAEQSRSEVFQIFERIEAQFMTARAFTHAVGQSDIQAQFGVRKSRHKHGHALFVSRPQNAAIFGVLREMLAYSMVELVGAEHFTRVPSLQYVEDYALDVIQIRFGLQGVIDPVVTLLVELGIRDVGVIAEVGASSGFNQAMRHQRASRNDGIHDATIDQFGNHQALLGNGHRASKSHYDKAVFVARHGLQNIRGLAKLTPCKRGLRHGTHQVVNRMYAAQI